MEFGSASEKTEGTEEQGAWARARQNVFFPRLPLSFLFSGRLGRRSEGPARIGNAGLGRDRVM